jgi:predicted nucleotidyltransferase
VFFSIKKSESHYSGNAPEKGAKMTPSDYYNRAKMRLFFLSDYGEGYKVKAGTKNNQG